MDSARALIALGWEVSFVSRCLRVSRAQLHVIDRKHTIKFCLSAKQRPYPTITIRGQFSDNMVYTEKHIRIIRVTTAVAILPVIGSSENAKCVCRIMRQNALLLERKPAVPAEWP